MPQQAITNIFETNKQTKVETQQRHRYTEEPNGNGNIRSKEYNNQNKKLRE